MITPSQATATIPDRYIDIGNITMRYRVAGTGDAVILLHGIGGFLEYPHADPTISAVRTSAGKPTGLVVV